MAAARSSVSTPPARPTPSPSLCIDATEVNALLDGLQAAPARTTNPTESRYPTAADRNNRGVDLCAQEQYEKAILELNKALRLNPYYALAYRNRAVTFLRIGAALPQGSRP
jgi:tetratricopeptide (TPR) repeat protein